MYKRQVSGNREAAQPGRDALEGLEKARALPGRLRVISAQQQEIRFRGFDLRDQGVEPLRGHAAAQVYIADKQRAQSPEVPRRAGNRQAQQARRGKEACLLYTSRCV